MEEVREKETAAALALLETIIHRMQKNLQVELREQRMRKWRNRLRPSIAALPLSELASGLKWVRRDAKPLVGTRLRNRQLERALSTKTDFTKEEEIVPYRAASLRPLSEERQLVLQACLARQCGGRA